MCIRDRLSQMTLELADRIRRRPENAARERSSADTMRMQDWLQEVAGHLRIAVHSIDKQLARLNAALGPTTVCRVVDGDNVPWLDALSPQLAGVVEMPPLAPVVTDLRGSPTIQLGISNSEPSMRLPFFVAIIGSEGNERLWLARTPLLYPPSDRASGTPYQIIFPDGPWPGRELSVISGPLPLFLESSVQQGQAFGIEGAADWLRLCAAYLALLESGSLLESADSWRSALEDAK